ncbi:MAG: selenocysteine-specific translation elongation factor [Candidatus Eremiobacter antarcticus]|nr:selenocysteine-specific translation elongation factor [Candidatus Eremiobacteraeota bacterium]MBC5807201.1 selenocysteine-specific translation elongation factor [Candidatus Eremiobacteraeota bacterium]PZR60977.1 MAG: selenocysteine-specific translation elongation factor [Candidatus Eremiobacter sp. RRmetagenome_bin22]
MHIVGTAGHVDHGKSSLVIALTGHNPDRFIEERERGMTLDLGFAPLRFPDDIEAGIIDVPGHERFLHNMLAGAAGMELLLLVIAANDGPRHQTFEHLQILNFLNVQRAIIVLTKIDLVDPESVEIAAALALDACSGTVAAAAPVVPVSSVTGQGIDQLKSEIHRALERLPARDENAPAYLPIDRVFAMRGHGTVVTGTLMQGTISVGDVLRLQPSGLQARVKNLQTFGSNRDRAVGGSRVAVNLPGIDVDQIARGETLVASETLDPASELAVEFTPLPAALPLLKRRLPVRAHIGSAEITGSLRFDGRTPVNGEPVRATVSLSRAAAVHPGLRIILRRLSPKDLLGGAVVSSAIPSSTGDDAQDWSGAPHATQSVATVLAAAGSVPKSAAKIASEANVVLPIANAALEWLVSEGRAVPLHKPAEFLGANAHQQLWLAAESFIARRHSGSPWKAGATTAEIAGQIGLANNEPLALRLLDRWRDEGLVAQHGKFWHHPAFVPALDKDQERFFSAGMATDAQSPFLPRPFGDLSSAAKRHSATAGEALEALIAFGAVVRIGDDVYRRSQIDAARSAISTALAEHGRATMAQLRDALGTSRRYALPLMEYFDSSGVTIREGDLRRLRQP